MDTAYDDLPGVQIDLLPREPVLFLDDPDSNWRRQATVSVVIPAVNEAENLHFVLPLVPEWVDEVVLVDGNSVDDTVRVAERIRPDVKVVRQTGRGKGNALAAGFAAAGGDVIVMLDADGSADPAEIQRFIEALDAGAYFAKGSRFAPGGGSQDITAIRRLGNAVLTTLVNVLFRARFSDLCYGLNAFRADCLPYLDVDCDGFEVETLMNIRAVRSGLPVSEVPSFEHARISGTSNLHAVRDGWRVLRTILRERVRMRARVPTRGSERGAVLGASSARGRAA